MNRLAYWAGVTFIVICLALAMKGCGDVEPPLCAPDVGVQEAAIVDGELSVERRSVVRVVVGGGGTCTGTVLGPRSVLTARHCLPARLVQVEGVSSFEVVALEAHPSVDLAVLFVGTDLPLPYTTIPSVPPRCSRLVAQGYGEDMVGTLQEVVVDYVSRGYGYITTSPGTCNGDSGGPLWAVEPDGTFVQVGVTSFGFAAPCDSLASYIDAIHFREWIMRRAL